MYFRGQGLQEEAETHNVFIAVAASGGIFCPTDILEARETSLQELAISVRAGWKAMVVL